MTRFVRLFPYFQDMCEIKRVEANVQTRFLFMVPNHGIHVREAFPECGSVTERREVKMPPPIERRRRERLGLHWAVRLTKGGQHAPVKSKTENISSEGFYCLCQELFTTGEELVCTLEVPSQTQTDRACLLLECRVRVVRVESNPTSSLFGVGFHIEDYSVMAVPRQPDTD